MKNNYYDDTKFVVITYERILSQSIGGAYDTFGCMDSLTSVYEQILVSFKAWLGILTEFGGVFMQSK